jgi:membrane fusion protein (multidrug efflux system)
MRYVVGALILLGVTIPTVAQESGPAAVPVGTVGAERRAISKSAEFVARIEAPNRVEIRARVKGYLETVLFREGDLVQEGAALYKIEPGLFEADVQQAQGALERSRAAHDLAVIQLQRAEDLLAKNAGTATARDQAVAAEHQSKGAMLSDEATLTTAQINLGYTNISAPITGRIGLSRVTKGNVVGPDSGVLATIVSQDPMYVTFPVSQRELMQRTAKGDIDPKSIAVRIRFSDNTIYDQIGQINFLDVTVDRSTDTVLARASIRNPKGSLIDGQLVTALLQAEKPDEKVVVPQPALIADQAGIYVFVVENDKAAMRRVVLEGEAGSDAVIREGLSGGEQVIVDGLQGVRPGTPVRASPMPKPLGGI